MDRRRRTPKVLLGVLLDVAALASASGAPPRGTAALSPPGVQVSEANGLYTIRGRFTVAVTLPETWSVLTDFGDLSRFVSSLRRSEVIGRRDREILVAQTMVARAFIFEKAFHVVLAVREVPERSIVFHDVSRSDFSEYDGEWSLTKRAGGVTVSYRLTTRPRRRPPWFVGVGTFRSTVSNLLSEVRSEILRRSGRTGGVRPEGGVR